MEKLAKLVERLLNRTQTRSLTWEETAVDGCFQVSLADSTIQISTEDIPGQDSLDYVIEIMNGYGSVIEEFSDRRLDKHFSSGTDYYDKMKSIYESARSQALGVDETLDSILEELKPDEASRRRK